MLTATIMRQGSVQRGMLLLALIAAGGCPRSSDSTAAAPQAPATRPAASSSPPTRPRTSASANSQPVALPRAQSLAQFLSGLKPTPGERKQLDARFNAGLATAEGKERELLLQARKDLLPLWSKEDPTQAELATAMKTTLRLLRQLAALHKTDLQLQLTVIAELHRAAASASDLGLNGGALQTEALERSRALVKRFPDAARAHAQLAHVLSLTPGATSLQAMQPLARCLELEPDNSYCRKFIRSLARQYRRPTCAGTPRLVVRRASRERPGAAHTTLQYDGRPLYLVGQPLLTGADVSQVVQDDRGATIVLTPAATKRFAAATKALTRRGPAQVALVARGKVLLAPTMSGPMDNGRIAVSSAVVLPSCAKVVRRRLPEKLRRLAHDVWRTTEAPTPDPEPGPAQPAPLHNR